MFVQPTTSSNCWNSPRTRTRTWSSLPVTSRFTAARWTKTAVTLDEGGGWFSRVVTKIIHSALCSSWNAGVWFVEQEEKAPRVGGRQPASAGEDSLVSEVTSWKLHSLLLSRSLNRPKVNWVVPVGFGFLLAHWFRVITSVLLFTCFFQVCDLEEKIVHSVQEVLKLIELGNRLRWDR